MKASEMWDIFISIFIILLTQRVVMGRDSSVGIATRYWVDVPDIECRWELYFPLPSRPALGPTQPPIHCVQGSRYGGKAAGAWR